jgi:hypothetical protein
VDENVIIHLLSPGGLKTEFHQIQQYLLRRSSRRIRKLTVQMIGFHPEIIQRNRNRRFLRYDGDDENDQRAECFAHIYEQWGTFYNMLHQLCQERGISFHLIFCQDARMLQISSLVIPRTVHILFTFDSFHESGSSIPFYETLRKKLASQRVTAMYISSNVLDDDVAIRYSNPWFFIEIQKVYSAIKKISVFCLFVSTGMLIATFGLKFSK